MRIIIFVIFSLSFLGCSSEWDNSAFQKKTEFIAPSEEEEEYKALFQEYRTRLSFEDYAELKEIAKDLTQGYYAKCQDGIALQRHDPIATDAYWRIISYKGNIQYLVRGGRTASKAEELNGVVLADARILVLFAKEVATLSYRSLSENMTWKDEPTGYAIHIEVVKNESEWRVVDKNNIPVSQTDCDNLPPFNI